MTSKSSENVLSINEHKAFLAVASSLKKPYSDSTHLYPENVLLPRPVWFKGSRDRGLREDIAAWNLG